MKKNSQFSVALHVLVHLSAKPGVSQTSEQLAHCVHTNAVVIRRVLGKLREAKIVTSMKGHGGGWSLNRVPQDINLKDIYSLLKEGMSFALSPPKSLPSCLIERALKDTLIAAYNAAEDMLLYQLSAITLADLNAKMLEAGHEH